MIRSILRLAARGHQHRAAESPAEESAWERMQEHFKALEKSSSTQVVGKARRERRALVHSALASGQRSIPTEGREGPVVA